MLSKGLLFNIDNCFDLFNLVLGLVTVTGQFGQTVTKTEGAGSIQDLDTTPPLLPEL